MRANFRDVRICLGEWGDKLPDDIYQWGGDYIISYLSRWVIPSELLNKAKCAAINFHPASPDYPGIGSMNFALYDGAKEFGVTCHFMEPKVDVGSIIAVKRFPVFESDTIASLLERTYVYQRALFYDVMGRVAMGEILSAGDETWSRQPYTRKELNALAIISPDFPADEISRRVRATTYGAWKPSVTLGNFTFELKQ